MKFTLYALCVALFTLNACAAPPVRSSKVQPTMAAIPSVTAETLNVRYVAPNGNDADPGTLAQPWKTINAAASRATAGQTVLIRQGTYNLAEQIRVANSGKADAWIVFKSYPGEVVVIDAFDINVGTSKLGIPFSHDDGAFYMPNVQYVRVENFSIRNSRGAGISARDSSHIDIIGNEVENTYSSGISAWDTHHTGESAQYIRILSNTVTRANSFAMLPKGYSAKQEAPHEAISLGGAVHFEVAYNHIFQSLKEGIDVKEVSRNGIVHHNLVEGCGRQGIYVDAWFGTLSDVEVFENVLRNNSGAGVAISVEGGKAAERVQIHHNLIYDNSGTGILFGRWGGDGLRSHIEIDHNTIHHNGHGAASGGDYYWITGGLFLYSANLSDVEIRDNVFSDNRGFQVGFSDQWLKLHADGEQALKSRRIVVRNNLLFSEQKVTYPIRVGWPPNDFADAYAITGQDAIEANPQFVAPGRGEFGLEVDSPARSAATTGDSLGAIQ